MNAATHSQIAEFIWDICNLLRGTYKRNEYRKVILPLTVLRRFDCLLAPTKARVLDAAKANKGKSENFVRQKLRGITRHPFYNLSLFDMPRLLDDPDHLAANLGRYINGFSDNVREVMDCFNFTVQIEIMDRHNLLYAVIKKFTGPDIDLSFPGYSVDQANVQMGYVFEGFIRIGAEQANEEAGEHFTPREVVHLMVDLLVTPDKDLAKGAKVKLIYDPACGTGGMLSVAEQRILNLNAQAKPKLFGQELNDETWAVCQSNMLIMGKGDDATIIRGSAFTDDGLRKDTQNRKMNFQYMLANPPFGVEWKKEKAFIENERAQLGYDGRFGAGMPRISDGSFLFLQHMLSKMRGPKRGGSRIAIVFSGSPLFSGGAGSGESDIRRWIIENDWLEAIVAMPEQLFYNTSIAAYLWILGNCKEPHRQGKVQLVDARNFWTPLRKNLGQKRREIGVEAIADIVKIFGDFRDGETRDFPGQPACVVGKIFDNEDFGYRKITVERPLRPHFRLSPERIGRLEQEKAFRKLAESKKKRETARRREVKEGEARQMQIRELLADFADSHGRKLYKSRKVFLADLRKVASKNDCRLSAAEVNCIVSALGERDQSAEPCADSRGRPEPDAELRDTENVPLKDDTDDYFRREVLPHAPGAWVDESKTKVGYEIPFNRHFHRHQPPRPLEVIEAEIKTLEKEIVAMLGEVA